MDRLQSMRIFSKVVELGGFARAAVALEMSNAVVTRYVADLESHLGTRLLNRTTRKLSLTETGHVYLERVRQILADIEDADAIAATSAKKPSGTLRIYSVPGFGVSQLAPLLPLFAKKFPDIILDIKISSHSIDMVEEGIDVGFFLDLQKIDSSMIARQLAAPEVMLCATPEYLRVNGTPQTLDDISQHRCLNYGFDFMRHNWMIHERDAEEFSYPGKSKQALKQIPVNSRVVSNNTDILRECALADMGLVLLPSYSLENDIRSGRLIRLLPDHLFGSVTIFMAYPSRRLLSAKVRSFINFIVEKFPHAGMTQQTL
ncbi:LysR family transcriptional regulator [Undibacterium sp. CY21W]|nr:LysR family transcriptional regulator [Undibacterium sp. CY21W]MBC3928893.1 LysR family transcriptional regulator [Undibacterium sp. CY21W]